MNMNASEICLGAEAVEPPEALAISAQSAAPRTRLRQSCRLVSASRHTNLLRLPGECWGGMGKSSITGRFPIYCRGRQGRKRGLQLLVKYSLVL